MFQKIKYFSQVQNLLFSLVATKEPVYSCASLLAFITAGGRDRLNLLTVRTQKVLNLCPSQNTKKRLAKASPIILISTQMLFHLFFVKLRYRIFELFYITTKRRCKYFVPNIFIIFFL